MNVIEGYTYIFKLNVPFFKSYAMIFVHYGHAIEFHIIPRILLFMCPC